MARTSEYRIGTESRWLEATGRFPRTDRHAAIRHTAPGIDPDETPSTRRRVTNDRQRP